MKNIRDWFERARDERFAIGAFNVANLETLKAVVQAAEKLKSPIIIEASSGESEFVGSGQLRGLVDEYIKDTALPIFLNLDHARETTAIDEAIADGFDLIHVDASELPYEENVLLTSEIAQKAHTVGLLVEGELDHIQGSSADHRKESLDSVVNTKLYTKPDLAKKFVEKTGIDTFAAFFGNVHGVFAQAPNLDFDLLEKIKKTLGKTYLSMHGGSGIVGEDVKKAIETGGIVKINVNSEMRIAFREMLEKVMTESEEVAAYKLMPPVIEAVQKVVEEKIQLFGSGGTV